MSGATREVEVGLTDDSLLWLASADKIGRLAVYEALQDAQDQISSRGVEGRGPQPLQWVQTSSERSSHDLALWDTGTNLICVVQVKSHGQAARDKFETYYKLISEARVEPPYLTKFNFSHLPSSTDFDKLVEALAVLHGRHSIWVEPDSFPHQIISNGIYNQLPAPPQLEALEKVMRLSADHVWGVSEARSSMKAILDRAQSKPQLLKRGEETYFLMHSDAFHGLPEKSSAADDAAFFFSRRSPVEVPQLSRGRQRAPSLVI